MTDRRPSECNNPRFPLQPVEVPWLIPPDGSITSRLRRRYIANGGGKQAAQSASMATFPDTGVGYEDQFGKIGLKAKTTRCSSALLGNIEAGGSVILEAASRGDIYLGSILAADYDLAP